MKAVSLLQEVEFRFLGRGNGDVIIGAWGADVPAGATYVIFGKASGFPADLNLSALDGTNGFKLSSLGDEFSGGSRGSTGAGDVNGDGFDDVIIGDASGVGYVVFGKARAFAPILNLSALDGSNGFKLSGAVRDLFARSVSGAGDVNGDGFSDLIIGAPKASPNGTYSGASYVVFGKSSGFAANLNLSALDGRNGFKLSGVATYDYSGIRVSAAGDVNGDGFDDLLIVAEGAAASYVVFGFDPRITPGSDGKSLTLTDVDGDAVTIKVSKGLLVPQDVVLGPDGILQVLSLGGDPRFQGANVSITATAVPDGNGLVDLGLFDATLLDIGKVTISGTLGRILAGDDDPGKSAVKSLKIGSLGTSADLIEPLVSDIRGSLGKLIINGDVRGAAVDVIGNLGKVIIGGDLVGDTSAGAILLASLLERGDVASHAQSDIPFGAIQAKNIPRFTVNGAINGGSVTTEGDIGNVTIGGDVHGGAIAAANQIEVINVSGKLIGDDPTHPAVIAAQGRLGSTKAAGAVAIDTLQVRGDVENALILLGYKKEQMDERNRYVQKNPDASAGRVVIDGNWIATSLVAGVFDTTGDGFGRNDQSIAGDDTPRIIASIASIVIKGSATGSSAEGDHYGITAQQVGKLTISGEKVALTKDDKDDLLLDQSNGDFRVVEV